MKKLIFLFAFATVLAAFAREIAEAAIITVATAVVSVATFAVAAFTAFAATETTMTATAAPFTTATVAAHAFAGQFNAHLATFEIYAFKAIEYLVDISILHLEERVNTLYIYLANCTATDAGIVANKAQHFTTAKIVYRT